MPGFDEIDFSPLDSLDEFDGPDYSALDSFDDDEDPKKKKKRKVRERMKQVGLDMPDDVYEDWDRAMGHESGRSHYDAKGKVKLGGLKTRSGKRAIGYGQIMKETADPYTKKYGLDPYKEEDNMAMSAYEFYKGDKDDRIARRLAYVGGPASKALAHYKKTGEVPDWKLYSYAPKNKETYRQYVQRTGGFDEPPTPEEEETYGAPQVSVTTGDIAPPKFATPPTTEEAEAFEKKFGVPVNRLWTGQPERQAAPATGAPTAPSSPSTGAVGEPIQAPKLPPGVQPKYDFEVTGKTPGGLVYQGQKDGKYTAKNADGDLYELDEKTKQFRPLGPTKNAVDTEGNKYTLAPDQTGMKPGDTRRIGPDGKTPYVFYGNGRVGREGALLPPEWMLGTTKPVTELPADPVLRTTYERLLKYGAKDSEEMRQQFIKGYNAKQAGKQKALFSDEDIAIIDEITGVQVVDETGQAPLIQTKLLKRAGSGKKAIATPQEQAVGQPTFIAEIDPAQVPEGMDPREGVFRQAAKQLGNQIYGRPLDKLEVDLLTLDQQQTKGGFAYSTGKDKKELDEVFKGSYEIAAEHAAKAKALLDRAQPELQKQREEALKQFMASGGNIDNAEAMAVFADLGLTPEMIRDLGSSVDTPFMKDVAKLKGEFQEKLDMYRQSPVYYEKMNALTLARKDMGWITAQQAQKELEDFAELQKEQEAKVRSLAGSPSKNLGPWDKDIQPASAQAQAEDVQTYLTRTLNKYGTATRRKEVMEAEAEEERARERRVDAYSWGKYWGESTRDFAFNTTKAAVNTALTGTLRGIALGAGLINRNVPTWLQDANAGKPVSEYGTYKLAGSIDDFFNRLLPTNKDLQQEFFAGKFPQGLGSTFGMALGGVVSKTPRLAVGLLSSLMMGGDEYKQVIDGGGTEEEAQLAGFLNYPLGVTEIFGVGEAINRLNKGLGSNVWQKMWREAWHAVKKELPEELVQEGGQTIATNAIARLVYDPDRKADKDLFDNLLVAGFSAPLASGGVTLLNFAANRHAIKKLIEQEEALGSVIRYQGGTELKIAGQKVKVTEEMQPLLDQYAAQRDAIVTLQKGIKKLEKQAKSADTEEAKKALLEQKFDTQAAINIIKDDQVAISKIVAQQAGIEVPDPVEPPLTPEERKTPIGPLPITEEEKKDVDDVLGQFGKYEEEEPKGVQGAEIPKAEPVVEAKPTEPTAPVVEAKPTEEPDFTPLEEAEVEEPAGEANINKPKPGDSFEFKRGLPEGLQFTAIIDRIETNSRGTEVVIYHTTKEPNREQRDILSAFQNQYMSHRPLPTAPVIPAAPVAAPVAAKPPMPASVAGETVEIEGVGEGRLLEIKEGKALVDHGKREINGRTVWSKQDWIPIEQVTLKGTKLSDYEQPVAEAKPEKPAKPTKPVSEPGLTPQVPIVPERPPIDTSVAEHRRKEGEYELEGVTYKRNELQTEAPRGLTGTVQFSQAEEPGFTYALIEEDQLTPADLGGNPNPQHFIPEAQPKDRSGRASKTASDEIAKNLDLEKLGHNQVAFFGAPITNTRGEVIQGNNRSEAIKKRYAQDDNYKQQLIGQAGKFGFSPNQIQEMKKPVLVRMMDVTDEDAILYGNFDVKDLESGGGIRLNPVAVSARIPYQEQSEFMREVFRDSDPDTTLKQAIRDNIDRVGKKLFKYLSLEQRESLFQKNTYKPTTEGIEDLVDLFTQFLFTKGHPQLRGEFNKLPHYAKEGLISALPQIFGVPADKTLVPDIQNAIIAAVSWIESGIEDYKQWAGQGDMINGYAAIDKYTPVELELVKLFRSAKTFSEIKRPMREYAEAINPKEATMFEPAEAGLSKSAAIKQVFKVEHPETTKYAEFEPTEQPSGTRGGEPTDQGAKTEEAPTEAGVTPTPEPEPATTEEPAVEAGEEPKTTSDLFKETIARLKAEAAAKAEAEKQVPPREKPTPTPPTAQPETAPTEEKPKDPYEEIGNIIDDEFFSLFEEGEPKFRDDVYARLKPQFDRAMSEIKFDTRAEEMDQFLRKLNERLSLTQLEKLEPFIVKYVEEGALPSATVTNVFVSGMSRTPADLRGVIAAGQPVGVSLLMPLSQTVVKELVDAANSGLPIFVDSGAFSAFTQGKEIDWERLMKDWSELVDKIDHGMRKNVHFVAPDVVGNHEETIQLQSQFAEHVEVLQTRNARIIIPVQKGGHGTLAGNVGDSSDNFTDWRNIVIGIPFNKEAWSVDDVVELARVEAQGRIRPGEPPMRIHLLGVGSATKLEEIRKAIDAVNPDVEISADATNLRVRLGEGKELTEAMKDARAAKEEELGRPLTKDERGKIRTAAVTEAMKPEADLTEGDIETMLGGALDEAFGEKEPEPEPEPEEEEEEKGYRGPWPGDAEFNKILEEQVSMRYPPGTLHQFENADFGVVDHVEGRKVFVRRRSSKTGKLGKPVKVDVESMTSFISTQDTIGDILAPKLLHLQAFGEPRSSKAATHVLDNMKTVREKGKSALDLVGDFIVSDVVANLIEKDYTNDPLKFARNHQYILHQMSPAQKTMLDLVLRGEFEKMFDSVLDGLSENTEYAPEDVDYEGELMTNHDLAEAVSERFGVGQKFENINEARKFVGDLLGIEINAGTEEAKRVDEVVELGVVIRAREIVEQYDVIDEFKYEQLQHLYELQPTLGTRTSKSILEQAYSTPAPLAFIASRLAGINESTRVYEPTAGNGMLLIEADPDNSLAWELNDDRAENLRELGFDAVTGDALARAVESGAYRHDAIIMNPPFGQVEHPGGGKREWTFGPFTTKQVDQAIALHSLQSLREGGRAVLILGGILESGEENRKAGYQAKGKKDFYFTLYNNYNVTDHFTVAGDLYKKQGTSFPVDVIVIDGLGKSSRTLPAGDLPKVYKSWDELGEKLENVTDRTAEDDAAFARAVGMGSERSGDAGPDRRSDPSAAEPRAESGTLSGLLSGPPVDTGESGGRPPSGAEEGGAKPERPRVTGGRDFSDSSESGNSRSERQPGDVGPPAQPRGDVRPTGEDAGTEQPERGGTVSGERPGGVAKQPANLEEAAKALDDLFGDDSEFFSIIEGEEKTEQPKFNDELYAKAKPMFQAAYDDVKASVASVREAGKKMIAYFKDVQKMSREKLERLLPYLAKFIHDLKQEILGTKEAPKEEGIARKQEERPEITPDLTAGKTHLPYVPKSAGKPMGTLIPVNMYTSTMNALDSLEAEVGNVDEYVRSKLGYATVEELIGTQEKDGYFGGEQVDALALAVYNMERGSGFIIGDQTGIGKGRVVAGVIRYPLHTEQIPIFATEKPNLYKDMYRDLIDIGMSPAEVRPLMTNSRGQSLPLLPLTDDAIDEVALYGTSGSHVKRMLINGSALQTPPPAKHNAALDRMAAARKLDKEFNIVFTTYDGGFNPLKGETARRRFLRALMPNAILIMDESHNAGGDGTTPRPPKAGEVAVPNRAEFARQMVDLANGVFYSSATWAKRPDTMTLYSKTDMSLGVTGGTSLVAAIQAGGVPLQQVTSAMLAESGQYLRRERSFEGIDYLTTEAKVDHQKAEEVAKIFKQVYDFSGFIANTIIGPLEGTLIAAGVSINPSLSVSTSTMLNNGFANTMHNAIKQMLLALKAQAAVDQAIQDLKNDKKVVLTVSSTMGALIERYVKDKKIKPGDAVNITFADVLRHYLFRSRTVSIGEPYKPRTTVVLSDDQLSPQGLAMYKQINDYIDSLDWTNLPGSPIDYMAAKLREEEVFDPQTKQKRKINVGEITGRTHALHYNEDGSMSYRVRSAKEISIKGRNETIKGFNSGSIDVIILNRAGATGLSLHASEKVTDQRQRVMILVQPEDNIDYHMQMLGRVNRTGQIIVPIYHQLTADIPAEVRPAANLGNKMKSLNANTTSETKSAVMAKDTLDFINKYGDQVIAGYLYDNPDTHEQLGHPLNNNPNGPGLDPTNAASRATGRLPMLPIAAQEEFYEAVAGAYRAFIDQLNQTGENDLEAKTLPLETNTLMQMEVFPPRGDRPFERSAIAESVEAKKLSKPHSQAEVLDMLRTKTESGEDADFAELRDAGERLTNDWHREQLEIIDPWIEEKLDELDTPDKVDAARTRMEGWKKSLRSAIREAPIGMTVTIELGSETYYGVVTNIRKMGRTKSPLALSDFEFTVVTTDATRRLHIPATQIFTPDNLPPPGTQRSALISQSFYQPIGFMGQEEPVIEAFDHGQNVRTERRTIITGNIFAGYAQFGQGRIVNFTRNDGTIVQGILMGPLFNLEKEVQDLPVAFEKPEQIIAFLGEGDRIATSVDGIVRFSHKDGIYTISVPGGSAGRRYFLNTDILNAAGGNFVSAGSNQIIRYNSNTINRLQDVIQVMMDQGTQFHTNTFKDAARDIMGIAKPTQETVGQATEANPAMDQAVAKREEVRERISQFEKQEFNHTTTGARIFVAKMKSRVENAKYREWLNEAIKNKGNYSSYQGGGAVPGFHFKTEESRQSFLDKIEGGDDVEMMSIFTDIMDGFKMTDEQSKAMKKRLRDRRMARQGMMIDPVAARNRLYEEGGPRTSLFEPTEVEKPDVEKILAAHMKKVRPNMPWQQGGEVETEYVSNREIRSGAYDPSDIEMFSLIGEHGVSNLPDARGRMQQLWMAKAMDAIGKQYTPERIWLATGWEKGADGIWKTEINDERAKMKETFGKDGPLTRFLDFPELFTAYPQLKNAYVLIDDTMMSRGSFYKTPDGRFVIKLGAKQTGKQKLDVLLHETQHAIQEIEGFAKGSSVKMFLPVIPPRGQIKMDEVEYWSGAIDIARDKYKRTAGEVEARNVQYRHDYTEHERSMNPPGITEDIARPRQIVIFEHEMKTLAMDETMMSIADSSEEEQNRRNAVRLLKKVPFNEVAPTIRPKRTGSRIKLNLTAMEILRRVFEGVDIDEGKRRFGHEEVYPSFMGVFTQPRRIAAGVAKLDQLVKDAQAENRPDIAGALESFARDLESAAKAGQGTVVLYVLDQKLPQELFHQKVYLRSVDKAVTARHSTPDKLDNSSQFQKSDDHYFSKQAEYSVDRIMQTRGVNKADATRIRNAIIREEIAAWTAEGSWEEIGLTEDEAMNYLLDFMKSFADKVYADHKRAGESDAKAKAARDEALEDFGEIDYARQAIDSILGRGSPASTFGNNVRGTDDTQQGRPGTAAQGAEGRDARPPRSQGTLGDLPAGFKPSTLVRPEPDASQYPATEEFPGVESKYALNRLPATLRAAGIAADDIIRTVFSDDAAQAEAVKFIEKHEFAGAYALLIDPNAISSPDVHHAIAAFAIQKVLQDESIRIEQTQPEKSKVLMDQVVKLGTVLSIRMVSAGRFIRAAGVLVKNTRSVVDTAVAIYQEQHGLGQDLPEAIKKRLTQKAKDFEGDLAEHEALLKQLQTLQKEIEALKKAQATPNAPAAGGSPRARASRRALVQKVKNKHKAEINAAYDHLRSLALIKSTFGVSERGEETVDMFSVFDQAILPKEILESFANIGVDVLLDGLEQPEMMRPGAFDDVIKGMFGDVVIPHLEAIHRESLRRRNDWLATEAKEAQTKAIIKQYGDYLSDEQIEAIIQGREDAIQRRGAIMRLHTLRAEKGKKIAKLSAIEERIAETAPNKAAAVAATMMIHSKPSAHELYRMLEAVDITGKEARDAIREGKETLEKAQLIQAKRDAEIREERRKRIESGDNELEKLNKAVVESRKRARQSHIEIEKELKRVGTGEWKFYLNLFGEALNTPRAVMASTDVSFILRQGGWFMLARAHKRDGSFTAMMDAFGETIGRKGYETAMAEMELNPYYQLAVKSGMDFAGLGKHGEFSITKGEEEFRNNIFGMIADATKDSKYHAINVARAPNAIIKKSDEIYTAFLDAQRLATFADSVAYFEKTLKLSFEEHPAEFKKLAEYINVATGRGTVGSAKITNLLMNLPLFAPRFTVSRFQLLYMSTKALAHVGLHYGTFKAIPLSLHAQKVIARDAAQFYSITGGLVALAWMLGASGGLDWDDDDFLKIKIGDSHLDPFVGMQQALRPMLRLIGLGVRGFTGYPRENIKLAKETLDKDGNVIGTKTYVDEVKTMLVDPDKGIPLRFLRQKLSPTFSLPLDAFVFGNDAVGNPFTWKEGLLSRSFPLGVQEVFKGLWSGDPLRAGLSTAALFGVGYTNYPDRTETAHTDAERLARKINNLRFVDTQEDDAQRKIDAKLTAVRERVAKGEGISVKDELDQLVENGEIAPKDRTNILKGIKETSFERTIRSMPEEGLKLVRSVANESEKTEIDSLLTKREKTKTETAQRKAAKEFLYGPAKPQPEKVDKPISTRLKTADVQDALVLYQQKQESLTEEQRNDMKRALRKKVRNSHERHMLTEENYNAAKKILGDELRFKFRPPKERKKKRVRGLESLENAY